MTNQPSSDLRTAYPTRSGESYLESIVHTASPARLRLLLIERAIDVAGTLSATWRDRRNLGTNEYSITLLDLLNELLSGVVGGHGGSVVGGPSTNEKKVCEQVSDLYVFLTQHLVAAEEKSDSGAIDEIATVLHIEAETWRAVCAQQGGHAGPVPTSGLNLQA